MADINNRPDYLTTMLMICIDGSDEALHHAYRRSITELAKFDAEFGPDSMPGYLDFKWEFIDRFRVLTIWTDGAGITMNLSTIPGLTDCLWVMYDENSDTYTSNDVKGEILNRKKLFGVPEADYEVDGSMVSETSGTVGFDPQSPDKLSVV